METRSMKELLIILRDNLESCFKKDNTLGGMCATITYLKHHLIISVDEEYKLKGYLMDNKPKNAIKRYKKYYEHEAASNFISRLHWWKPRAISPRIKWLNEQINKV